MGYISEVTKSQTQLSRSTDSDALILDLAYFPVTVLSLCLLHALVSFSFSTIRVRIYLHSLASVTLFIYILMWFSLP